MNPRTLPILNGIGCLALTGLVFAQWRKERTLDSALIGVRTQLAAAQDQASSEAKRRAALERDIAVLKEAIEGTQRAAESSARSLAEKDERLTQVQGELSAALAQITRWQAAIEARDERIRLLDTHLATARQRLNEAIAKLKTVEAR
jgi:chromosome segregation ATPase